MEENDTKGGNVGSLESEICRILVEGFGLGNEVIAIEGGDCSHLDLEESTVNEKIKVNGEVCHEKRKKIYPDDLVEIQGIGTLVVVKEEAGE